MALAQFAREYRTVRRAEGWGSHDGAYYRNLPFKDVSGRFPAIWRIRARSYETFVTQILEPLERGTDPDFSAAGSAAASEAGRHGSDTRTASVPEGSTSAVSFGAWECGRQSLRILDVGAGSGWLAARLALRGHRVLAVDLLDDPLDGLGARKHYAAGFAAVLAEYDRLPLPDHQLDLVVFNASLHYSTDYAATLRETMRVLTQHGTLVILDSPMYVDPTSGARMVKERQDRFLASYGFASDALPSEHFLTPDRLRALASDLGLDWQVHTPGLDWRSALSRRIAGLRARREPASFPVIEGRSRT